MPEVARRCQECGIEVRDLTDGLEDARDTAPTTRQRVMTVFTTIAAILVGTLISSLAIIGCVTVLFTTAFIWPWLPWA